MFEEILVILLVVILVDLLARLMYQMLEKMLMLIFSNTGSLLRLYTFGLVFESSTFLHKIPPFLRPPGLLTFGNSAITSRTTYFATEFQR